MVKLEQNVYIAPITTCRVCKGKDLIEIASLGHHKLSDFIDSDSDHSVASYPLELVLCETCCLLQLHHTTPPKELYTNRYGYRSGINLTMRNELSVIVSKAESIVSFNPGSVVTDIGCNDGTLLSLYTNDTITRVGFDPVKNFKKYFIQNLAPVDSSQYKLFGTFFSSKPFIQTYKKNSSKVVTAIAMFYDLDDPNKFLEEVKQIMHPDGLLIIQQNYLVGMLNLCAFDNIVHEHLAYYSLESLENLLNRHNFEVFDVEETSINGGSFRTFIKVKGSPLTIQGGQERVEKMRAEEKRLRLNDKNIYLEFASKVNRIRCNLEKFIRKEVKKGKKVYIYGASTRGNTLLQACGLNNKLITAAAERNVDKWGKKIASTGIPIVSEEQAREAKPDYFLVLPWFFAQGVNSEFIQRERDYLLQGGKLIIPLPELKVISKNDIIHT